MTVPSSDRPFIVRPGDGLDVPLGWCGAIHKMASRITDGQVAIIEHKLPPGRLAAPLHRHSREDELSFVVSGHMGALLGDEVTSARAGSYLLKPRGQWHTLWNAGPTDLRFIELILPGGLECYFERLSPMLGAAVPPDADVIERTAAEYGIEFDFASVPEICQRFGVTLEGWPKPVSRSSQATSSAD